MTKKRLLILLAGTVACHAAAPTSPADKPMTESDLLKQIETLSPVKSPATPKPGGGGSASSLLANPPPEQIGSATEHISPGTPGTPDPGEKKAKGPTEITALEATFDQRGNVAVFIGSVVVKDPEFNVICDKLTAYLKHEDKTAAAKGLKATPKPVTPTPAAAKGKGAAATPAPRGGGLDHAIAVTTSDRRVIITQDKVEADGSVTHGIGKSDWATYDAKTGDIVLHGSPDVTKGNDRCIATDPGTVMTLTRDGNMRAVGPHKTIIIDDTPRDGTKPDAAKPDAGTGTASKVDTGARNPQQ